MPADPERMEQGGLGIAVVIVNFRTPDLTADAARSVLHEPHVDEIVVVDNGSGDGSVGMLRQALVHPVVRILESPTNLGFGRGVNLAVSECSAPLLFLLNSDAVVVPGALGRLSAVLANDHSVGIAAPAVYCLDGTTLQQGAFGPLPRPVAFFRVSPRRVREGDPSRTPGWVSGAAMLTRRADFTALGGFDPDFEMYLEDVDLCRRMLAAGLHPERVPAAKVVHLVAQSNTSPASRLAQFHRSKAVYLRKTGASPLQQRCGRVLSATRLALARLRLPRG